MSSDDIDGGAGDDAILYPGDLDDINGGSGVDPVEVSNAAAVSISLDDVANDSRIGDLFKYNVHSDVENVKGSDQGDTLIGSALANRLTGGQGGDTIDGGAGPDTLLGGEGNDTIDARDGVADSVDCGVGTDTATVDPVDTVSGCETVNLPDDDGDGVTAPQDCDDGNATIRPGAVDVAGDGIDQDCSGADTPGPPPPPVLDGDGDGSLVPADCNDGDATIRPGATDKPGDRIDQDCNGRDATFPVIGAGIQNRWIPGAEATEVVLLAVRNAPARAAVGVRCAGKGCPFERRTVRATGKGKAKLTALFKGAKLKPGARIEIRVTAPGSVGKVVRYTIRKRKLPGVRVLCLPPGGKRPRATC